jgi:hypothetical protein
MATDDPGAVWPTSISVSAYLAVDEAQMFAGVVADGAPAGRFVLRNAFGPRVLRCGYELAPNAPWWPSRILLDGRDITNTPMDFSAHETATLEVWFTRHPARISGVVTTAAGQPARAPWILTSSSDRTLQQEWASTNHVRQADTVGRFSIPVLPGSYLVRAVPQAMFDSFQSARREILRLAPAGVKVDVVKDREIQTINLTLRP